MISSTLYTFDLSWTIGKPYRIDQVRLKQRFPTEGSRTPGGSKQHFQGAEMRFSWVRICMSLDVFLWNKQDLQNLAIAI